mgnify:CR=1 FL=1
MKILLINGSLRGDYSSSLKVAHAFVKGMVEEYGAVKGCSCLFMGNNR